MALAALSEVREPEEFIDFFSLTRSELTELIHQRFSARPYSATQLFEWVYRKGSTDISGMTNIGGELRRQLTEVIQFRRAEMVDRRISLDGTRKYLFEVSPGVRVESVMIKQPKRFTLCVSSQFGCGMGCAFCRTATMGFQGNLSAGDIIRQVVAVIEDAREFGDSFQNIVFMGMGEPLHNVREVSKAIRILRDDRGLGMGGRKITVSTVGLVPGIEKLGAEGLEVNLAVSLNATTDEVRSAIMPINRKFPLEKLTDAIKKFPLKKKQTVTLEYVMLKDVNDTADDLDRLTSIALSLPVKLNLIPYNENAGLGFSTPPKNRIFHWQKELNSRGICATIRWSKGVDINAACGQLASVNPPR